MLTLGHLASSYIISQAPSFWGKSLTKKEVFFVIISGYALDFDLFLARSFGVKPAYHHFLPTHTPLFAFLLIIIAVLFFRRFFSSVALFLGGIALFSHLVLDDIGYWFYKLGLQKESSIPQIFWLYPFDERKKVFLESTIQDRTGFEAIRFYLIKAPINVFLEALFGILALLLFIRAWKSQFTVSDAKVSRGLNRQQQKTTE